MASYESAVGKLFQRTEFYYRLDEYQQLVHHKVYASIGSREIIKVSLLTVSSLSEFTITFFHSQIYCDQPFTGRSQTTVRQLQSTEIHLLHDYGSLHIVIIAVIRLISYLFQHIETGRCLRATIWGAWRCVLRSSISFQIQRQHPAAGVTLQSNMLSAIRRLSQ